MSTKQVNVLRRLLRVLNSRVTYCDDQEVRLKIFHPEIKALFTLANEVHLKRWCDKGSKGWCDNLYDFLGEVKLKQTFETHSKCIARNLYLSTREGDLYLFKRLVKSAIEAYECDDLACIISQLQEQFCCETSEMISQPCHFPTSVSSIQFVSI